MASARQLNNDCYRETWAEPPGGELGICNFLYRDRNNLNGAELDEGAPIPDRLTCRKGALSRSETSSSLQSKQQKEPASADHEHLVAMNRERVVPSPKSQWEVGRALACGPS